MADYLIKDTTLRSIADAIRTKIGNQSLLKTSQMADAIRSIQTGGGGSVIPSGLTATVNDVAFGKTFIGANGITETGSLKDYDGDIDVL